MRRKWFDCRQNVLSLTKPSMGCRVRFGSRLCENYFARSAAQDWFVPHSNFARIIRPERPVDSNVAPPGLAATFSHSLGHKRTLWLRPRMSCVYRKLDSPRYGSDLRVGHRFRTPHLPDSGSPSSMGRADYTNRFRPIFCGIEFSVHTPQIASSF